MPNTVNYAEVWQPELLDILAQETLCTPFITSNVRWLDAKTFHFTSMSVSGFKVHNRNGGWNRGEYRQTDHPFTVAHDRDIEFLVDRADVDESNATASIQNIARVFTRTQSAPEKDALFFSKVAATAKGLDGYHSETAAADFTKDAVFGKLKAMLSAGKLRRYKAQGGLIMYVTSAIMDALEQCPDFTRNIVVTQVADGGAGLETRVTDIDGVPVMEVIDDEVFYDSFNFSPEGGGFAPTAVAYAKTADADVVPGKTYYTEASGQYTKVESPQKASLSTYYEQTAAAHKINVLIATPLTTKLVPKISSIYYFNPGAHTEGDGYLYQERELSDVFTFPNGKDGKVDSVYVDVDTAVVS